MRLKAASVIIGAAMLLTACAAGTPEAEAPSSSMPAVESTAPTEEDVPVLSASPECQTDWGEKDQDYKVSALAFTTSTAKYISPEFGAVDDESIIRVGSYYCELLVGGVPKDEARTISWLTALSMQSLSDLDQIQYYALLDTYACPCT